ncbi:MAG: hypothetical protein HY534_01810 [Chloroflexi bacterium]|nr:hypothetical protein [Chloroflexota bacterium]
MASRFSRQPTRSTPRAPHIPWVSGAWTALICTVGIVAFVVSVGKANFQLLPRPEREPLPVRVSSPPTADYARITDHPRTVISVTFDENGRAETRWEEMEAPPVAPLREELLPTILQDRAPPR